MPEDFQILKLVHEPTFLILIIGVLLILISLSRRVKKLEEGMVKALKLISELKEKVDKDLKNDEHLMDVVDQFLNSKERREVISNLSKEKRKALEIDTSDESEENK